MMNMTILKDQCENLIKSHWGRKALEGKSPPAFYVFEKDGEVYQVQCRVGSENDTESEKIRKKRETSATMKVVSQDEKVQAILLIMDSEIKDEEGVQDSLLSLLHTPNESHYRNILYRDNWFCDEGWTEVAECGGRFGNPWKDS